MPKLILIALVAQAHTQAAQKSIDHARHSVDNVANGLVDNLFERLFHQSAKKLPLHRTNLESTTFAKPGHVTLPSRHTLRPIPFGTRAAGHFRRGFANSGSAYHQHMCKGVISDDRVHAIMTDLKAQENRVAQQMKAAMADPKIREQAEQVSQQIRQMKATMADPKIQEQAKQVVEQISAYTVDSNVQEHMKRIEGQVNMLFDDPGVQEQTKQAFEQVGAQGADSNFQGRAKLMAEKMKTVMGSSGVQQHIHRITEEIQKTFTDPNVQKPAKRVAEQIKLYMTNPSVREGARHVAEQLKTTITSVHDQSKRTVQQMRADGNIQHAAKQMKQMIANSRTAALEQRKHLENANMQGGSLSHQALAAAAAAAAVFPAAAMAADGPGASSVFTDLAFADQAGNLAGTFFGASLFPYLAFLYFLRQDRNGLSPLAKGGFTFLLAFVFGTVICSIVSTKSFSLSLANVDWLHADAEQLLAFTNILDVVGLKLTLDGFTSGTLTQPATKEQAAEAGLGEGAAVAAITGLTGLTVALTWFASGGDLAAHSPFLGGVGNLPEGLLPLTEPDNALSVPTWIVHISSLLEWLVAQGLVWRIALASGNPAWKGMTWAMIPSHSSGITACTYHVFYNQIPDLVLLQSALTFIGNSCLAFAAYRIAASNGWEFSLPSFGGGEQGEATDGATSSSATEALVPVDEDVGKAGSLATIFAYTFIASYVIKYGGAALPVTSEAPEWLAFLIIAAPTAFNVYKWDERSKTGGDFNGPI
eukprot:gnl/MRDRNA2_/MRDRNA2_96766_c0_seq1.p1 gnl/MRDRNA2_/MRDRNA2_96766_c0~~gnl/MRDRNA2_/MRDRNA2_96766_c0_seq1.p1  ORF type:complete len:759 (+),score=145.04 gnl/MRDRNA2_/MRDRNA2_96766_c0_seq1:48-2324(+)